ncbi:hypothetical protein MNEG_12816 [Monoraphidium neglectum]|uniref:Uncharacterized protein n=1 Tax=Monoraphidium neglectum TaxID=145388 RepID=A0A0D2J5M1_9CHLO|nr:hypothetical protein MNEG_12816 [Monoraphidium neglectum]KIY95147.1 hypothetical protein MNEG_12816 [Monoraphidium neglectum]|eukprot:XP_013894167.1 hypothetical protein MNEG_12816 [Monoraphidium neglectum]
MPSVAALLLVNMLGGITCASPQAAPKKQKLALCAPVKALTKSCSSKAGPTALMDQLCSELLAPANATADSKDPMKLHYGCGVATTAQVNRVSGDLAALEPKITAAAAQVSSVHATVVQGSNQTAALRAQVVELTAAAAALSALVQQLQANAAEPTGTGTIIAQELAALAAADTHTAQKLALLAAANQTAAQDIAALKAAKQQCTCGPELFAVDTTLTAIKAAQTANAAAVSLANATVESVKATITINAAATASFNTSLTSLAADVVNVSATVSATLSAINFTIYAKTDDLANINAER